VARVRRYIITGAPGAGKTTVVDGLRERGYAVVAEAATEVRRISYEDSVSFERLHEAAYREHGFDLVEVPPGPPEERIRLVESYLGAARTSS
jgi:predicted ATPase